MYYHLWRCKSLRWEALWTKVLSANGDYPIAFSLFWNKSKLSNGTYAALSDKRIWWSGSEDFRDWHYHWKLATTNERHIVCRREGIIRRYLDQANYANQLTHTSLKTRGATTGLRVDEWCLSCRGECYSSDAGGCPIPIDRGKTSSCDVWVRPEEEEESYHTVPTS